MEVDSSCGVTINVDGQQVKGASQGVQK